MISVTDLATNTAYALGARQTIDSEDTSRLEHYADHAVKLASKLRQLKIQHIAADAYYSKKTFVDAATNAKLHVVGKLRVDADLRWLYSGDYQGTGRPKKYDGKIDYEADLQRFEDAGMLDDAISVYTQVVYSQSLKRTIRLVMLGRVSQEGKVHRTLLYSTDCQ